MRSSGRLGPLATKNPACLAAGGTRDRSCRLLSAWASSIPPSKEDDDPKNADKYDEPCQSRERERHGGRAKRAARLSHWGDPSSIVKFASLGPSAEREAGQPLSRRCGLPPDTNRGGGTRELPPFRGNRSLAWLGAERGWEAHGGLAGHVFPPTTNPIGERQNERWAKASDRCHRGRRPRPMRATSPVRRATSPDKDRVTVLHSHRSMRRAPRRAGPNPT